MLVVYVKSLGRSLRGSLQNKCMFHSQYNQDSFLEKNYFRGKKNGIYLDLGAYSPYEISNTAFFDSCYDWTGICIDANPNRAAEFAKHRSCEFISTCLTYSTIKKTTTTNMDFEDHINDGMVPVSCTPIMKILKDRKIKHIDYLSIDIEGQEWAVLQQLNFSEISVDAISIETWHGNRTVIRDYLQDSGFVHAAELGADDIYFMREKPYLPPNIKIWRNTIRTLRPIKEY
jgi:hypothetical protein